VRGREKKISGFRKKVERSKRAPDRKGALFAVGKTCKFGLQRRERTVFLTRKLKIQGRKNEKSKKVQ